MRLSEERKQLFKEMCETVAVSGKEKMMARLLKKHYEPLCDEIFYDNLGSIIAHKKSKNPNAPKVLVLAHMDEVGFRIGDILADGTLRFAPTRSGVWDQTLMAQRVYIQTRDYKLIPGVIDTIPPHQLTAALRSQPMTFDKMYIDVGAKSRAEVEAMGIRRFDACVVRGDFEELGDGSRLLAKAFDDRIGCILGVEVLQELLNEELDIDLYVGASVQEEVGTRGAQTVTQMIHPDFAIVVDCSPASDMGGAKDQYGQLGGGLLLRYVDASMLAFPALINYQEEMAKKCEVKAQPYLSQGGTDAGVVHKCFDGVLTLTQCLCARNIHTNASIIDLDDYEGSKKVLLAMLRDLNADKIQEFREEAR